MHRFLSKASQMDDSLAQLVEHNTFNVGVMGSSPMRVTVKPKWSEIKDFFGSPFFMSTSKVK